MGVETKHFPEDEALKLPRPFLMRRLHSILGLWLVIFLCQHLLVNSQAALYFADEGSSFVRMVNQIHNIPFLPAVEIILLGLPFLIHGVWGIFYALSGKLNAHKTDGSKPSLPMYRRNKAFGWQRITAWILLVGVIAHVVQMRFVEQPVHVQYGGRGYYMINLPLTRKLPLAAEQLGGEIYTQEGLDEKIAAYEQAIAEEGSDSVAELSRLEEERQWLEGAARRFPKGKEVLVVTSSAGSAIYLVVRDTFRYPAFVVLYSVFVISASYHAFNGLWTFMITWGLTLTRRAQRAARKVTNVLMAVVMFLGLFAIWGTYWTTVFAG